jgi:hypothetical protein
LLPVIPPTRWRTRRSSFESDEATFLDHPREELWRGERVLISSLHPSQKSCTALRGVRIDVERPP